jgi:hypothetical protein
MRINIYNFVKAKAAKLPEILIDMALAVIDTSVKEKTGVMLTDIKPICYLDGITIPTMLLCGDEDELIKQPDIKKMFSAMKTRIKRLRMVRGGHSGERSAFLFRDIAKFCVRILKNNGIEKARKTLAPIKPMKIENGIRRDSIAQEGSVFNKTHNQSTMQINLPSNNNSTASYSQNLTNEGSQYLHPSSLEQFNTSKISTLLRDNKIDKN